MAKTHSTQHQTGSPAAPGAIGRVGLCLAVIACGLALRGFGFQLGLPAFVVKYGGSLLWGTMVFFLVALTLPHRPRRQVALIALAIANCVELFRLVHTPWLDAFRLTTSGALLLGRIFSVWNMVAYAAGILLGVAIDRLTASSR
ncbi:MULTISPECIES: DUF2809 domain-containing protein [unclassified Bradyrhizobium]|uniref:ribosomal maturation YjgA family protein n=1 Tax=unclassified Bradyrhizobium TaxID=2631580 RepID=UPI002479EB08|nr:MULTISPECIES: DUF2809 domain-containing protein [unclassified Bradyrhizobium]WGS19580.1 DUF2809 domain-containing protein [Bradyrhizobium sp. ISRA463]WGS26418.1 DUF2809 domain-containing protein [Bradyrhizobium sp. ISRA464]